MQAFDQLPPLCLYIHIPWCVKKCPYCDFNSHAMKDGLPENFYVEQLLADLRSDIAYIQDRPIHSIFIGGGTPSLFSGAAIKQLLNGLQEQVKFSSSMEITLEANPGTVEQQRFIEFYASGINRISLGVQSFQDEKLKKLGRIHGAEEAKAALLTAKKAGFSNINIDLMFGLPDQTTEDALFDLQTAIALEPTHISWYQLTLEPNTLFYKNPPTLPDDDLSWQIQEAGQALLQKNDYHQYEVSAYAQPNKQCAHNLNYWLFGDYLGIGAGAHGKISIANQGILRTIKHKHPKKYLDVLTPQKNPTNPFLMEQHSITAKELPFEFMLNALRLQQKIPLSLFEQRTGLSKNILQNQLNKAYQKKLLCMNDSCLEMTALGKRFLNELMQMFL